MRGLVEAMHLGSAIGVLCLVLAAGWPSVTTRIVPLLLGCLAILAGTCSGFLQNERRDARFDALDKAYRPIPSGRLSSRAALVGFWVLYGVACAAAVVTVFFAEAGWFLITYVIAGVAYTPLKYIFGALKDVICAISFTLPVCFGLALAGRLESDWLALVVVFLFIAYREMVMDVADRRADERAGIRSLAVTLGPHRALVIAGVFLAAALVLTPLMPLERWQYLIWLPVLVVSAWQFTSVLKMPDGGPWRRLTISMWLPMVAFALLLI